MTRQRKGSKRQARRASIAAKRAAFSTGNKKAPAFSQGYAFRATGCPTSDPAAEPITPPNGAIGNEICLVL